MSDTILVTGGAGYLGSILVPELLAQGHRVLVLDNFLYRQNSLAAVCAHPAFTVVNGDIRSEATLRPLLAQTDVVIPLAAIVGAPACAQDPVGAHSVNFDAMRMLLDRLSSQQKVLMPTTNSAYGTGGEQNHCTEESPLRPISQYAQEKVEIEQRLLQHENAISFRLATIFGMSPRMRMDLLVNDFTYRAVTDRALVLFEAHFKRNYLHVRDVARVFLHALDRFKEMRGQIYNVGLSDANLSKLELCQCIQRYLPDFVVMEAPIGQDPDQRNYIVSNVKVEATGFRPAFSLDDGIQELIKGYTMIRKQGYGNI
ncbi:MAG: NAD(P)-dependent oxidoreductase [Candidatus Competibacteraceae bacterium]|nr:NAD(P)-dependent oxidoreductase [Candidatus Competibacteraceae bacterium]